MKNMGESGESFNSQLFPGPRSFRRMSLCTVVLNATQGGERMWFGSDCSELVIPRAVSLWTRVRYGFWGGTPEKVEWEGARPREPK